MPETKAVSTLDNVVVKSPNDRRLYRVIELDNGLSALLIHDPDIYPEGYAADQIDEDDEDGEEEEDSDGSYEDDEEDEEGDDEDDDEVEGKGDQQTKKAAAAMCVAMGSFLDPPEAQGLAHFLEHMLFMGSSEFPDENEYDSYLSKHGGSSNAYTEMEHTCYHFEVKREFLQGALKRFSQFFVAPLMKTEAMEREVLAVDSEFNQALQNDACRLQQLQCYTSAKGHPFNRFSWGNKKSLSGAMENGIYDIIAYTYQYLKLLRDASPQEWIFKELQDIGNMDFRYAEEQAADDYAAELSENMLAYPVEHIIYGDYVYRTWDSKMIADLMGFFTPKNMRIDVVSKSIKSEEFQTEPWFGSHYIVEDVPLVLMETWINPSEVDNSLHLPSENQFIPSDFSIRATSSDGDLKSQSPPKCIIDEPLMKFWYKLDETFKASIAKLETSLSMYGDKLELKVFGFNEKIPALLSKILAIAKSFMPSLDRFKVIKENMERGLRNTNMKPLNHSTYLRLQLLCKRIYDSDEKLSVLNDLSLTDLNSFIPEVRSQIFIEALCHGNLSEDEAVNISNIFKNSLTVEPLPVKSRHGEQITCFPLSAKLVRDVNVKNKSETNSVVELYYQIEPEEAKSTRMKAVLDLFSEIIEEPLFNQLRTKEQLGYVVECGPRLTYRVHGFCFCVQSSKYGPVHLLGRIDNFIKDIEGMLEQLDEESFEDYRSGLIGRLLEKDPSLLSETNELWSQIVDKRYMFDYSQKEAEELRSIEKKDVMKWYKTYFKESSPKSRRLAVRVWGCDTNMEETQTDPKSVQVIADAVAFKSTSKFYPSLC
ncbi:hypothetical protein DY000_02052012 [Brassica cretica]|uniref:Peptidase M16 N-terminal domain-containing protein n=1 Tax=Brassica cretica TaxID=69181 RepID=A0ABQ7AEX3_BRACR|nr:hypothetical protein DY000_02052012 [Brassica cretica]